MSVQLNRRPSSDFQFAAPWSPPHVLSTRTPFGSDAVSLHFRAAFPARLQQNKDCVPTPPAVVQRMMALAGIKARMKVLEPSAGTGNIAKELRKVFGIDLRLIEFDAELREMLRGKGYNVIGNDFLALNQPGFYDRILMNPPFSNNQCITHIKHAYDQLKPGGKLVAVVPWYVAEPNSGPTFNFHRKWLQRQHIEHQFEQLDLHAFDAEECHLERPLPAYLLTISKAK